MSHSASDGSAQDARHGLRIFLIWLPLAIIADVLIWFVWYPHLPPGRMTDQAQGQQFDIAVMAMLAAPVLLFVWVYFAYALIVWRRRADDDEDGAAHPRQHPGPGDLDHRHRGDRARPVRVRHGPVDRAGRRGRGPGPGTELAAQHDQHPAGAGHRPAVGLHLPVPPVRRHGDHPAPAAQGAAGPVQRDLAGRHPQLLGLPARGEGGRQPRREQRRVRQAAAATGASRSAATSCAGSGTGPCSTTATW